MEKFKTVESAGAALRITNIDTDQIIPARFMKTIKREGLGRHLFHDLRFAADGSEKPGFVLVKPAFKDAKVLIADDNFGCGSSREHAPWALADYGIRVVIAPSFADIFFNNAFKNGLLLIRLPEETVHALMDEAEQGANATFTIDLEAQEIIRPNGDKVAFEVDPFRKHCLLEGLDDIGLTLQKKAAIDAYETKHLTDMPWLSKSATG
ncbi:MAG: 3-isopropylmalate dehydratase small subunit [Alphaproteobacteria bacterium]|nr:3-isopropylmalate dehydratase small subunit [Alphaproteobacteria bacterium]